MFGDDFWVICDVFWKYVCFCDVDDLIVDVKCIEDRCCSCGKGNY